MGARIDCPIAAHAGRFERLSQDMLSTMRRMRRDLDECQNCPALNNCSVLEIFNTHIQTAIQEINDEWELSVMPRNIHPS